MPKPKLIIFIEYYLPGYKFGGPTQSVANLVLLLRDRYSLYLVTRDRDFGDTAPYPDILSDTWLPRPDYQIMYLSPGRITLRFLHRLLREQPFDFVYTNSLFAGFTRLLLVLSGWTGQRLVVAPRGELHAGAIRLKAYKKRPFVALLRLLPQNRIVWHATDQEEIASIRRLFTRSKIRYAPVRLAPDTPRLLHRRLNHAKQAGRVRLVYVSRITPKKGLAFLLALLADVPTGQIDLAIYGPIVDAAYWRLCQERIDRLLPNCRVTYQGAIPHTQVSDVLKQHDMLVLPTSGENFGHAIFEALSVGLPVLISDQTPWQQLDSRGAGWSLPLDQPAWLRALQQALACDEQQYNHWSEGAVAVAADYLKTGNFEESYGRLFAAEPPAQTNPSVGQKPATYA